MRRTFDEATVGDKLGPLEFHLPVYRLVMAAGANRDFNSIHHNTEYARAGGAPEMYANNLFLQGMWERLARDYIGMGGVIRRLAGFRMNSFNCAGDTVVVEGEVTRKWREGELGLVEIRMWSRVGERVSVGPGVLLASLPDGPAGKSGEQ